MKSENTNRFQCQLAAHSARLITLILIALGGGILFLLFCSLIDFPAQGDFGPFRKALLITLSAFFAMILDLRLSGLTRNWFGSWALVLAGGAYFIALSVLSYRYPNRALLNRIGFFSFLALSALLAGILIRLNELSEGKFSANRGLSSRFIKILVLAYLLLSLHPVLRSGFYWDDAFFSVQIPALRLNHISIWRQTWDEIVHYVSRGRINPFATFQFLSFYLLTDERMYKAFLILLTAASSWSFWIMIRTIFNDDRRSLLLLLLLPLCFQLRLYHDPLTSYYGLMQMLLLEFCSSMTLFILGLREGRKSFQIWSIVLFTVGLLSYEMFYPLAALFPLAAWYERGNLRDAIRAAGAHILAAVVLFALSFGLRLNAAGSGVAAYNGTAISSDPGKFLSAWWNQMMSAVPFNYRLSEAELKITGRLVFPREIFNTTFSTFLGSVEWCDILGLAIFFIVFSESRPTLAKFKPSQVNRRRLLFGFLFAAALLASSSVVIALSAKYQEELIPGIGYLPVYFGYFAVALILGLLVVLIYPLLAKLTNADTAFLLVFAFFAVVYAMNRQADRAVVRVMNEGFHYPRQAAEAALRAGILDPISDGDTLVSNQGTALWEQGWERDRSISDFYALYSGRRVSAIDALAAIETFEPDDPSATAIEFPEGTYLIEASGNGESGIVKFGHLNRADVPLDPTETHGSVQLRNPITTSVYVFVVGFSRSADTISYVGWSGIGVDLPLRDAWLIRTTPAGRLYKIDDPKSIQFDTIGLTSYR